MATPTGQLPIQGFLGVIDGVSFTNYVNGILTNNQATGPTPLSAVSVAVGGTPVAAFSTTTQNVNVAGATTSMVAFTAPTQFPGTNVDWQAYVVASGIVQVVVTNSSNATVTPTSTTYQVRVIQ